MFVYAGRTDRFTGLTINVIAPASVAPGAQLPVVAVSVFDLVGPNISLTTKFSGFMEVSMVFLSKYSTSKF